MLMYAWYVFKSWPAPGGKEGRILVEFAPDIWIIGGDDEGRGGEGDGGALLRRGVRIGEGEWWRSGLQVRVDIAQGQGCIFLWKSFPVTRKIHPSSGVLMQIKCGL